MVQHVSLRSLNEAVMTAQIGGVLWVLKPSFEALHHMEIDCWSRTRFENVVAAFVQTGVGAVMVSGVGGLQETGSSTL